ncbi:MAG TPA: hypothetical protein VH044_07095 [Polyangiaceae bacterium]|jgi:hypothetical protein|nr:hypothetical protein [Polyangiaceae bacterium]
MGVSKPLAPEVGDEAFLADEFVLDDAVEAASAPPPSTSNIVFSAPSDAPPGLPAVRPPPRRPDASPRRSMADERTVITPRVIAPTVIASAAHAPASRYAAIALALVAAAVAVRLVRPAEPAHAPDDAPLSAARHPAETPIVEPAIPAERVDAVEPTTSQVAPPGPLPGASAGAQAGDARALEAKHASQVALEKGRTADAIEAGERSVALDPADAEAWLILGAAYDQRGAYARGRASFKNCVDLATRGPRGECAALLR